MIDRYTLPEMRELWTDSAKFRQWMRVEWIVCQNLARTHVIPPKDWRELSRRWKEVESKKSLRAERVLEIEQVVKHDVIAFTTALAELIGPTSRWVHFGLTSSDVLDTAAALTWQEACGLVLKEMDLLIATLRKRAKEFEGLATIGRSHGMFAEPTSFGLKFLGSYEEWKRNRTRFARAAEGLRFGKLSGAVGAGATFGPKQEKEILRGLGLEREPVSTQVIPRDRHAELFSVVAICGASMERLSVELRHLQRSEVGEAREAFTAGQKGSSAMPHKRNPISAENLTGLARLLRSYAGAALENVALWHERDISHSSVERVIAPDALTLLHYGIRRLTRVVGDIEVDRKRVAQNLEKAGPIVRSGHLLLALVRAGAPREEAYRWIQACALSAMDGEPSQANRLFVERLQAHPEISKYANAVMIRNAVDAKSALRNIKAIFRESLRERGAK